MSEIFLSIIFVLLGGNFVIHFSLLSKHFFLSLLSFALTFTLMLSDYCSECFAIVFAHYMTDQRLRVTQYIIFCSEEYLITLSHLQNACAGSDTGYLVKLQLFPLKFSVPCMLLSHWLLVATDVISS